MAESLIKYETIDASQIKDIMAGKEPKPPEGWTVRVDGVNRSDNNQHSQVLHDDKPKLSDDA
jgi:cell division protease FtsH